MWPYLLTSVCMCASSCVLSPRPPHTRTREDRAARSLAPPLTLQPRRRPRAQACAAWPLLLALDQLLDLPPSSSCRRTKCGEKTKNYQRVRTNLHYTNTRYRKWPCNALGKYAVAAATAGSRGVPPRMCRARAAVCASAASGFHLSRAASSDSRSGHDGGPLHGQDGGQA